MSFNLVGSGAPSSTVQGSPSGSPALYLDQAAGVVYILSNQGWQPVLYSVAANLTAHAGGGQQAAASSAAVVQEYTTVATLNDSATLPKANVPGLSITVANRGANSMNVFPLSGDAINSLAANAAFAVAANKSAEFICTQAGHWIALASA